MIHLHVTATSSVAVVVVVATVAAAVSVAVVNAVMNQSSITVTVILSMEPFSTAVLTNPSANPLSKLSRDFCTTQIVRAQAQDIAFLSSTLAWHPSTTLLDRLSSPQLK